MEETIESLKKKLEHYEKKFSMAEHDIAIDGYMAYVNIVKQQVSHVKGFDIKTNIEGKKSDNAMYERTEAMWKNLPDMISSMNKLKVELNIPFNENEGKEKQKAVSPQSIGS